MGQDNRSLRLPRSLVQCGKRLPPQTQQSTRKGQSKQRQLAKPPSKNTKNRVLTRITKPPRKISKSAKEALKFYHFFLTLSIVKLSHGLGVFELKINKFI